MRRISRFVTVAMLLIGVAPMVAGCADGELDMDKLDVLGLNQKKPLPGKREALFPNGVPGVEQGIPPEYMKGNLAQQPGAAVPMGPLTTQPAGSPNAQTASAEPPAAEHGLSCRFEAYQDELRVTVRAPVPADFAPDTDTIGWIMLGALVDDLGWKHADGFGTVSLLKRIEAPKSA